MSEGRRVLRTVDDLTALLADAKAAPSHCHAIKAFAFITQAHAAKGVYESALREYGAACQAGEWQLADDLRQIAVNALDANMDHTAAAYREAFHAGESFFEVLTAAINDLEEHGYDSADRLTMWQKRLLDAAHNSLKPAPEMERMLNEAMLTIYRKMVEKDEWIKYHPGISRFALDRVKPSLRAELDRRIMASAELIRLNRAKAIEQTLQRFTGWATSIPAGGSERIEKVETKATVRKALASLPFEERRVLIDQGHKLISSINEVIASGNGALGGLWRSHFRQPGYNYREDHKERDGRFYMLRGNWALTAGLAKAGPDGYYDDITHAGELVFCRCWMVWIYNLGSLPSECVTKKGSDALQSARAEIQRMGAA